MPAAEELSAAGQSPEDLAGALHARLEQYLAEHPQAAVVDEGRVAFEMARSRYSLSSEHGRCILQLWSDEQNCLRTVIGLEARKDTLNVKVRRFGRTEPQTLQFVADRDTRPPSARQGMRNRFLRDMERLIAREWNEWTLSGMRSAMDLEHSFGPAYARGLLTRGQSAWALIAVNPQEMPATIDGILTLGILWLDQCRQRQGTRRLVEGLRMIVPAGMACVTASRVAWMNASIAKWEVWELERQGDALLPVEIGRQGNLKTRLTHAFNPVAVLERFEASTRRIYEMVPAGDRERVEVRVRSASEVSLSLHGLEFARVRHGYAPGSFQRQDTVTFGAGPNETVLSEDNEAMLRQLVERLFARRRAGSGSHDALYRLQPERWLEASLRGDLGEIEPSLNLEHVYSQVPAFAAGDRGMLDLLTVNRDGRLAVLELKADEDLQLPLQGLDYWLRVHQLNQRYGTQPCELQSSGYFPSVALSAETPLLYFVAPALRMHPSNAIVLAHFSPEIQWQTIALNEDWRVKRKVIFRKSAAPVPVGG